MRYLAGPILVALVTTSAIAGTTQPTRENPIVVDESSHSLRFLAEVNGKYFHQVTRHLAAFKNGKNGNKAIFRSFASPSAFYGGLVAIGAKSGGNMTLTNKETTHVEGDSLAVSLTWENAPKAYDINEAVIDSNGKPISFKFGGNLANAKVRATGCLLCLDSCPVGIASNPAYTYGAVEKRGEVEFTGNEEVLPPDGTAVVVTVSLGK